MSEISMIPGMSIASGGLHAMRRRLDVIAENIANASTTRGADGEAYRRRIVHLESEVDGAPVARPAPARPGTPLVRTRSGHRAGLGLVAAPQQLGGGVQVAGVATDTSPLPRVYDPAHPDADADGFVEMPNVDLLAEMVDLMLASRAYEANLTVLEASRENAKQTIDLLR